MAGGSYGAARTAVLVAAALHAGVAAAFAFAAPLLREGERPLDGLDVLGHTALFAAYAAPALLAVLALRGRPLLLLAAAGLSLLLAFTALSGVSLVLLLPGAVYLGSFLRVGVPPGRGLAALALVAAVLALGVAGFAALFVRTEQVCWRYEVRGDGTTTYERIPARDADSLSLSAAGDVVEAGGGCKQRATAPWALASLGLVALALLVGASRGAVAGPRPG